MAFSSLVLRQLLSEAEQVSIAHPDLIMGIVDPSRLQSDGVWIPDAEMFEIVARTQRASGSPGLGLRLGARGSFTALGAAGNYIAIAESFRHAVWALAKLGGVARHSGGICVRETERTLSIEFDRLDAPSSVRECMGEWVLSSLATVLARYAGPGAHPLRVMFDFPAPSHVSLYQEMFACEISFDQPRCTLVVDNALADRVQLLSQPELANQIWHLAQQQLSQAQDLRSIVEHVREGLRAGSDIKPPRISLLARRLGMSERSLRRRLAEQGVDYRTLVSERQQEIASELLRQHGVSVKEVAYGLGYTSVSAFHRAYRRWTGSSPKGPPPSVRH